jgi:hypothetical protein
MSLTKHRTKPVPVPVVVPTEPTTPWERLKHECAAHIQPFSTHRAGGGSLYIYAGDVKIRIANHSNTSKYREDPDYNIVSENEDISPVEDFGDWAKAHPEDYDGMLCRIDYPETVKKTIFAKHLGLTVPKLKILLKDTADCFDEICENEAYPNTYTEVVVCEEALKIATDAGITMRVPIRFGVSSFEDWNGRF